MPRQVGWEVLVYVLSGLAAAVTYGWVVYDGIVTKHWMHPFTLHPVFAYAIAGFLGWRHRRRRGHLMILAGVLVAVGGVGLALILTYYTPDAANRVKLMTIMFVPLAQMFI
ncbi:MAG TPA: hypothetical protein PKC45_00620, partial [Gemmatales bacterium]|nr:hypothetical protein [Gemmatales bacterium]